VRLTNQSINNTLLCLEIPDLVSRLRSVFNTPSKQLTIRTGWKLYWDVAKSHVSITEQDGNKWTVPVGEMGGAVQDIYVKGGLEKWVRSQL
jgi:homoaconitate hydratase